VIIADVQERAASTPGGRLLDELAAYAFLDRLGIAHAAAVALTAATERVPPLPFPFPVAVKALSADLVHKTDAGGVVLGVADADALLAAIRRIRTALAAARSDVRVDRVLVAQMAVGIGEALIGYRVDGDTGPLVMVAVGGIDTEIHRDRSLRLAPVDLVTAREMIGQVRGLQGMMGFRGRPKGDLDALARAIVALSQLASDERVLDAEVNPLIVRAEGHGVVAVDALVRLA
jgi:succinyl-CoA synthetase beta subunit